MLHLCVDTIFRSLKNNLAEFEEVEDICDKRTDRISSPIEAGLVLDWRNDKLDQNAYHQSSLCHETITPQTSNLQYGIYITMVEIYNDRIFDLLETPLPGKPRSEIRLINDAVTRRVTLSRSTKLFVSTVQEAFRVLERGLKKRVSHSTGSNETSSRSHAIINLEIKATMPNSNQVRSSTITFADLAGTERNKLAGTQGIRFQESCAINQSLMLLSQGLQLQRGDERKGKPDYSIFRNCKLTHLLLTNTFRPDSNQRSALLVAMDPFGDLNSAAQILRYAAPVRDIPETANKSTPNNFVFKPAPENDHNNQSPRAKASRRTDSSKLNHALSSLTLKDNTPSPNTPSFKSTPSHIMFPPIKSHKQTPSIGFSPINARANNHEMHDDMDQSTPVPQYETQRSRDSLSSSNSSDQSTDTLADGDRNQVDIMSLIPDTETACYNIQLMLQRIQDLEVALACSEQRTMEIDMEVRNELGDLLDRSLTQQKQIFMRELEETETRARDHTDYRLQLLAQTLRTSEVEPLQKIITQAEAEMRGLKRENRELRQENEKLKEIVRRGNSSSYGHTATFRPISSGTNSSTGLRTPRNGSPVKRGFMSPGSPIVIDG